MVGDPYIAFTCFPQGRSTRARRRTFKNDVLVEISTGPRRTGTIRAAFEPKCIFGILHETMVVHERSLRDCDVVKPEI